MLVHVNSFLNKMHAGFNPGIAFFEYKKRMQSNSGHIKKIIIINTTIGEDVYAVLGATLRDAFLTAFSHCGLFKIYFNQMNPNNELPSSLLGFSAEANTASASKLKSLNSNALPLVKTIKNVDPRGINVFSAHALFSSATAALTTFFSTGRMVDGIVKEKVLLTFLNKSKSESKLSVILCAA